jgi:hypothetical protein
MDLQRSIERLSVYRCVSCGQVYFFALDVADHQNETGHRDFVRINPD